MKSSLLLLSLASCVLIGTGCVAFNVGEPKTVPRVDSPWGKPFEKELSRTLRSADVELTDVSPDQKAGVARVSIQVSGSFSATFQPYVRYTRREVTVQRKMSFGLYPVWAEWIWKPDKAADPAWSRKLENVFVEWAGCSEAAPVAGAIGFLLVGSIGSCIASVAVPYSLLVAPFYGNYEGFTNNDNPSPILFVPLGFHRYQTTTWGRKLSDLEVTNGAQQTRDVSCRATGPFNVWLVIPELSYSKTISVPWGQTTAMFEVPMDSVDREVEARIGVFAPNEMERQPSKDTLALLDKVSRRYFVGNITLPGAVEPVVRKEVVVERVVVRSDPPRPGKAPYDIVEESPLRNGRVLYRVAILDESKTKLEILRLVRPEIERILTNAFLAENPGADESKIRVLVVPDLGRERLFFDVRGTAVSTEPAVTKWTYDSESGAGTIQILLPRGMDAQKAKAWTRKNIGAIVADKGIAVEVGKSPPSGAKYRIFGKETISDNGELTLSFEIGN